MNEQNTFQTTQQSLKVINSIFEFSRILKKVDSLPSIDYSRVESIKRRIVFNILFHPFLKRHEQWQSLI
jgi:hypothetical protein